MKFASLLLAAAGLSTATAQPTFDEVLSRIRHNVEVFETQLPDFVCAEKINSRTVAEKDGSVEKETVIQSTFSGRQNHSALSKLGGLSSAAEPDPGSFVVAFTTRNSKQKMREKNGTVSFQAAGRAGFDPASFEIIRLEERILAKGEPAGSRLGIGAPCGGGQGRARRVRRRIQRLPEIRRFQHDPLPEPGTTVRRKSPASGRWAS
jgi:hypothetical protein